jgi:hypothetical protein
MTDRNPFDTLRENPFEGICADCHYPFDATSIGRPSGRDATICVSCDDLRISAECDEEQTR